MNDTYEAIERLRGFAQQMRTTPSPAEVSILKTMRRLGFSWQHVFAPFIVDFYHSRLRLVVEVDGRFHENQKRYDQSRTSYLIGNYNVRVVRYNASDCFNGRAMAHLGQFIKARQPIDYSPLKKAKRKTNRKKRKYLSSPGISVVSQWSQMAADQFR